MSELSTYLIEDSRISNITDKEVYGVMSGANQSTFQSFQATSKSSNSIIFNCQIPNENIVIDRHLLIQATINLVLNLTAADIPLTGSSALVFDLGLTDAIGPFIINSLCQSQSCSINNCTVSQNTRDILAPLLRLYDNRKLNRYNSITASMPDAFYYDYADGVGSLNNVLSSYNNASLDNDFLSRGGFPVTIKRVYHSYLDNNGAKQSDTSLVQIGGTTNNTWQIAIEINSIEPFIALSPWTNTQNNNQAGLCGINTISMNLNLGDCSRAFSTSLNYIKSITLGGTIVDNNGTVLDTYEPFTNANLLMNFLSLQPEQYQKINSRNVIPYMDFPRYISISSSNTILKFATRDALGQITLSTQDYDSPNIQLSIIPDLIIIFARKNISTQTWRDSSSFFTINSISCTFNNSAGLCSSMNPQQLYLMSNKNGSGQTWNEFCGLSKNNYTATVDDDGILSYDYGEFGRGKDVPTIGSILIINPSLDLNLPSYLANGSLGQFNVSFRISLSNQGLDSTGSGLAGYSPEICCICVNSGFMITESGVTAIQTGVLTKELTLKTKDQKATIDHIDYKRYVGGSLSNMGMSNVYKLFKKKNHINDERTDDTTINNHGTGLSAGSLSAGRIKRLSKHIK